MDNTPEVATAGKPVGSRVEAVRGFFLNVQSEMKKVTWPTRPELIKATRMVVILSLVLGVDDRPSRLGAAADSGPRRRGDRAVGAHGDLPLVRDPDDRGP